MLDPALRMRQLNSEGRSTVFIGHVKTWPMTTAGISIRGSTPQQKNRIIHNA